MAASWNSLYGGRHQVYGNINHTGSEISINAFSFFTSIAWLEYGKLGQPSLHTYKVLSFSITQYRRGLNLLTSIKHWIFFLCDNVPFLRHGHICHYKTDSQNIQVKKNKTNEAPEVRILSAKASRALFLVQAPQ